MRSDSPDRRRLTIGLLMAAIALLAIPLFLAVPVIRLGGIPHHMTMIQTARWLAIERDNACVRCHGGAARRAAFEIPIDPRPGPDRSSPLLSRSDGRSRNTSTSIND